MKWLCNEVTDNQFWVKFGGKFESVVVLKGHFGSVSARQVSRNVSYLSFMAMTTIFTSGKATMRTTGKKYLFTSECHIAKQVNGSYITNLKL